MASTPDYIERSVRFPRPMYKRLQKIADAELSSVTREVLIAVRAHLDANERGKK